MLARTRYSHFSTSSGDHDVAAISEGRSPRIDDAIIRFEKFLERTGKAAAEHGHADSVFIEKRAGSRQNAASFFHNSWSMIESPIGRSKSGYLDVKTRRLVDRGDVAERVTTRRPNRPDSRSVAGAERPRSGPPGSRPSPHTRAPVPRLRTWSSLIVYDGGLITLWQNGVKSEDWENSP